MPTKTETRAFRQLEQALRTIRLAGRAGIGKVQLGRALRVGVGRAVRIAGALDTAGLVDVAIGRNARVVARPPSTIPEDVQMDTAVAVYLADEHAAQRERLARIRGDQPA